MDSTSDIIHRAWRVLKSQKLQLNLVSADQLMDACQSRQIAAPDITLDEIGFSRSGRPIPAFTLGDGPVGVSIKGNAHADEPAGIVTGLLLIRLLAEHPAWQPLRSLFRFYIVPSANPDGLHRNSGWLPGPFDLRRYFLNVYRDLPADDVEFGYPQGTEKASADIRPENMACAQFFDDAFPLSAHVSLHSIVFTGGAWFLVSADPDVSLYSASLSFMRRGCEDEGLPLHDEDRGGQKGFSRIEEGFHSAPTVEGMKAYFAKSGDGNLSDDFRLNSMQYTMRNCGARFAAVTEVPYCYDRALANMTPTDHPRSDLEIRRAEEYGESLVELEGTLNDFSGADLNHEGDFWRDYLASYLSYRRSGLVALTRDLDRFAGKSAALRDLYDVNLMILRQRVFNAAAAVTLCNATGLDPTYSEAERYQRDFNTRFDEMEARFDFREVPLERQVRLQLATILAALLATSERL